jgi:hypothetical protein
VEFEWTDEGAHRYWRVMGDTEITIVFQEVQFWETLRNDGCVTGYLVVRARDGSVVASIAASDRPTAASPLDVAPWIEDANWSDPMQRKWDLRVYAVNRLGQRSVRYARSLAWTTSTMVAVPFAGPLRQAGTATAQPGSDYLAGDRRGNSLTADSFIAIKSDPAAPLSAAGELHLRDNAGTLEASISGAAYAPIGTGGGGADPDLTLETVAISGAGPFHNVAADPAVWIHNLSGHADMAEVTGFDSTGAANRIALIVNAETGARLVLKHANAGSLTANRLDLPNDADVILDSGNGCAIFWNGTNWQAVIVPQATALVVQRAAFVGDGGTTSWVLTVPCATGGLIFVAVSGSPRAAADWTAGANLVTTGDTPGNTEPIECAYFSQKPSGLNVACEDAVGNDSDTDFVLAHSPKDVYIVVADGSVRSTTAWSIVGGNTLRYVTPPVASGYIAYSW